jgi:predicted phosphodiesterase
MPAQPLDPAILKRALELLEEHKGNMTHAANAAGLSRGTFAHHIREAKRRSDEAPPERESYHAGRRVPQSADEAWALLDDFIKRKRIPEAKPPKARKSHRIKTVGISDLHCPFVEPEAVALMIRNDLHDADRLVINGDLVDLYSASRFPKHQRVPFEMEMASLDAFLATVTAIVPEVILSRGNHDDRLDRLVRASLPQDVVQALEWMVDGSLDPVRVLASRYPNVRTEQMEYAGSGVGWAMQVDDLIFCHAERYSKVPTAVTRALDEWFTDHEDELALRKWRVLFQAHTHTLSRIPWKADRLLMEMGCLCKPMPYQAGAKAVGRGQRRGYVTMITEDGDTDVNTVRDWWLDKYLRRAA